MADARVYPESRSMSAVKYIKDVEVAFGVTKTQRFRLSPTQLAAVTVLLPALPGVRWRMIDMAMIAIGGNATTSTSINVSGVLATVANELLVTAVAALTRSALVRAGAANAVILADGGSFTQQDANAAITAKSTVATLTVSTFIDIFLDYVADPA